MTVRAFVASPLTPAHADLIRALAPDLDLVFEPDLIPDPLWAADHVGDPAYTRTPEQRARYDAHCASAEILYGLPDNSPAKLAEVVASNPRLRWVQTMAAGGGSQVKAANLADADLARVTFTTSAGVHAVPLAEFSVFGVLAGAKGLPRLQGQQAAHEWGPRWTMRHVSQLTVVVVGLGHIGRQCVASFAALGARVIGVNRSIRDVPGAERVVTTDRLLEVAAEADALVLTLPDALGTPGLVSREVLEATRPGCIVTNVGRGLTVDEPALVELLASGHLAFAALDVTAVEPLPSDSPLWDLSNVLIAPHCAALDDEEPRLIAELFADNARRLIAGDAMRNVVDTVNWY